MHARLTSDENAPDLDRAGVLAARDQVKDAISTQLSTFARLGVRDLLLERLGHEVYEAMILDIANNVVQGLL